MLVIQDGAAVLYARPSSSRDTDEFFRDRMYGEILATHGLELIPYTRGISTRELKERVLARTRAAGQSGGPPTPVGRSNQ